jgi:hypothetical protein
LPCETSYNGHRYTPLILLCMRVLISVGRGTGPNEYNGNRLYREHVRRLKDDYRLADCRRAKDLFVVEAIDAVTSKGGRFLRKVQKGKPNKGLGGRDLYEVADADSVVEKTRQAFQYCRRQRTEDSVAVTSTSTGGETAPYPAPTTVTPSLQEHSDSSSIHSSRGSNAVTSQTTKKVDMPPHQLQDQVSVMPTVGFKTDAGPMGYGQGLIPSALGIAHLQSMPHGPPSSTASGRHPIESVYYRAPGATTVESALRNFAGLSDRDESAPLSLQQILGSQSHAAPWYGGMGHMPHLSNVGQDPRLASYTDPMSDMFRRSSPSNPLDEALMARIWLLAALNPGSELQHQASMLARQQERQSLLAQALLRSPGFR